MVSGIRRGTDSGVSYLAAGGPLHFTGGGNQLTEYGGQT